MQAGGYGSNSPKYNKEDKDKTSMPKPKSDLENILDQIQIRIKNQKPLGQLRDDLDSASVDPGGWGISHNTQAGKEQNERKSTEEIIAEIQARTEAGKPTYILRQELNKRSVDAYPTEPDYDEYD